MRLGRDVAAMVPFWVDVEADDFHSAISVAGIMAAQMACLACGCTPAGACGVYNEGLAVVKHGHVVVVVYPVCAKCSTPNARAGEVNSSHRRLARDVYLRERRLGPPPLVDGDKGTVLTPPRIRFSAEAVRVGREAGTISDEDIRMMLKDGYLFEPPSKP